MISVAWSEPTERRNIPEIFRNANYVSLQEIARDICNQHQITLKHLLSDRRSAQYVKARQHFMYRAHCETHHTLTEIGKYLGKRHHTTVAHGINKHKERIGEEEWNTPTT
jgi:chromosomal replication initiation ATPase DnaA